MKNNIERIYKKLITSSFIKSSSVYTISGFINAAIPLMLLPVLTRYLSPADYGIVAMFQIAVSITYPLIGMNLEGGVGRKYYDKDNSELSSYIGTSLLIFSLGFLFVALIITLFNEFIFHITQIPKIWIKFIVIVSASQFLVNLLLIIFQVMVEPLKYAVLQISRSIFNIGLTLYLVVLFDKTWDGRIQSQILTGVIFGLISLFFLFKKKMIKFRIKKKDINYALKFGIPLIPHALGAILFTAIDRFFVTDLLGLEETGNYSVAFQLAAVVGILTISINNAFVPWLFENLNKNSKTINEKIVRWTYFYFIALIFFALFVIIILPFVIRVFVGKSFNNLNTYTTFIVFGFVFQGMYYMVTNYILYANKTYIQAIVTISIAIIKIPITYFLIIWLGGFGASLSYCITFFLFFITTWFLSSNVYEMPWKSVLLNSFTQKKNR